MTCDLAREGASRDSADLYQFGRLHRDGRQLVCDWFRRARDGRNSAPDASFESFIYLWIAFNAWAACVTGEERDTAWRDALIADRRICSDFAQLVAEQGSPLNREAVRFQELLPIFKVEELRRMNVDYWTDQGADRRERAERFRAAGARLFEPQCWFAHEAGGDGMPMDWAHTMSALYRVRCNLFHGEKARSSENDQLVVRAAYSTLLEFLDASGYLQ